MSAAPASRTAVVLLSGGLDSTTCLAVARRDGFAVVALSFRYGQRHAHEVEAARRIAAAAGVARHVVIDIDLRTFGGSALTADIAVPKNSAPEASPSEASPSEAVPSEAAPSEAASEAVAGVAPAIPVTYVPARNTIFLSYALALAETSGAGDIFLGVSAVDYSGYPDCRPEYVAAFERVANLATRAGVEAAAHGDVALRLRTPLLHLSKADTIRLGTSLGVDYGMTTSCYDPVQGEDGAWLACGHCDACRLRRKGFEDAGVLDPTRYAAG